MYKASIDKALHHARMGEYDLLKALVEDFDEKHRVEDGHPSLIDTKPAMRIMEYLSREDLFGDKEVMNAFSSARFQTDAYADQVKELAACNFERGNITAFRNMADFIREAQIPHRLKDWQLASLAYMASKHAKSDSDLKTLSDAVPISPATGILLLDRGFDSDTVIDALRLDTHMYGYHDSKTRVVEDNFDTNNPDAKHPQVYDASGYVSLATRMLRKEDRDGAARLIELLINCPLLEYSNFSLHGIYSIIMLHTWSDPEFMSIFSRNEQRLVSVLDTFISLEPNNDSLLSTLTPAQLKLFLTGPGAEVSEVTRDLAMHMADSGAKNLGRLIYHFSNERITASDELIKAAERIGGFNTTSLSILFKRSSESFNSLTFYSKMNLTNLGAFLNYAERNNIELNWNDKDTEDGINIRGLAQLVNWSSAYRDAMEKGGDKKWWIENLSNALFSIPSPEIRNSITNHKITDNIPEMKETLFYKRHAISQSLDL